eukprot:gb/GEZJ01007125.1/.p1 GENE.gb/GEZJ01007125.1/~~gb/GEZJ01007125.1/.p1  ORF type:complete len:187 (-),score=10.82 gb/GEZJ01007125.1/:1708-2268(-)
MYKTIRITFAAHLMETSVAQSSSLFVRSVLRGPCTARVRRDIDPANYMSTDPGNCVRLNFLSIFGKLDIVTYQLYAEVFEKPRRRRAAFISIESHRFVQHHVAAIGIDLALWVTYNDAVCAASLEDRLNVSCRSWPKNLDSVGGGVSGTGCIIQEGPENPTGFGKILVCGTVGSIWCIASSSGTQV